MDPQTGGKLLAEGSYGCIYIPNLKCKGEAQTLPANDQVAHDIHIDKLMSIKHAALEFALAKQIQTIPSWKDYYLVPDTLCEPEPKEYQTNANINNCAVVNKFDWKDLRILRMKYGGTSLREYRVNIQTFDLQRFTINLLEAVALLTLNGIVHMDLHDGNILVADSMVAAGTESAARRSIVHLIDFNLSVNKVTEVNVEKRLNHAYQPNLPQISPDYFLMNSHLKLLQGDPEVPALQKLIEDMVERKAIFRKLRSVLGITKAEQYTGLLAFVQKSHAFKEGKFEKWFALYWRMNDSWAVGCILVELIARFSLWPTYTLPALFANSKSTGMRVLRKMCETNPAYRYDPVQALNELDPQNAIIKNYGQPWLKRLATL